MNSALIFICAAALFIALILLCLGGAVFHIVFARKGRLASKIISLGENKFLSEFSQELAIGKEMLTRIEKREVCIKSYDGLSLQGYFIKGKEPSRTIICVHGYRGSPSHDFGPAANKLLEFGNLLLIDQRAHGKSEGKFITFGIRECQDCKSWAQFLMNEKGENHPVYLSGVSMGATSVLLASALDLPTNIRGIIADCGFTSPEEIIKEVANKFIKIKTSTNAVVSGIDLYCRIFARFSIKQMHTQNAMRKNKLPVLFVHGLCDKLVPHTMTQKAFDACTAPKFLVLSEKADHGMSYLVDFKKYSDALQNLFCECEKNTT